MDTNGHEMVREVKTLEMLKRPMSRNQKGWVVPNKASICGLCATMG